MFSLMFLVVKMFLLPLSSTKKDVLLWVLTVKKENAVAERSVRSVRREVLDAFVVFGRRQIERLLRGGLSPFLFSLGYTTTPSGGQRN